MKPVHIHSRVRIADGAALAAALRGPKETRPEPDQMLWAGRLACVTGYRRGSEDRPYYMLQGAPGLWAEEWLDPL